MNRSFCDLILFTEAPNKTSFRYNTGYDPRKRQIADGLR